MKRVPEGKAIAVVVDSIAGNVHDLDGVLAAVYELVGLKPFLRFELELPHGAVRVAQVMCGDVSLEFLEQAHGQHPDGAGRICRVVVEIPGREPQELALEPGLCFAVRPGAKRRVAEIEIESSRVAEDLAVLQSGCRAVAAPGGEEGERALQLGTVTLRFRPLAYGTAPGTIVDPGQRLPGWHRIGLACKRLEEGTAVLVQAGARVEEPPYQVLPGLREAMLRLPSNLMVQPVEQKLWKMLPVVGVRALACRLTGRPLRFKTTEA
ncbi:MAG: hypothetical protein JXA93_11880 [Anaerolineae bacterium]|nr:hypothetical protein [Anaerolineae bacterium]